ncbi:uncharacterized protein I303_102956 [Kwoniella dejecticola CBS 10117]|uniref:Cation efflux protein transmembrane domain-containing protein n=1 Tax=Kwoniella dejecticola CBS 10117 TaxID=1296121 RepID=A0A1A6AA75_9TREE|nr:uncharacterized protein I303_02975 [Kwoniella dejecticola CBS 10117]OBR86953.1 hypothetical protein I303_02975 [Kwoniella dejecticola CBS 10117]
MQAPATPTPLHRTVHKVPSRRSLFSAASPPQSSISRPNSYLGLFVGALAVAASKTWVLDDSRNLGGGVGWLVLGLWAGRIIGELKEFASDGRRKAKDASRRPSGSIRLSIALALQSVAFFLALQHIGPLRISIVAFASSLATCASLSDINTIAPLAPILAASVYIIGQAAIDNGVGFASAVIFAGSTFLSDQHLSTLMSDRPHADEKEKPSKNKGLWYCVVSSGVASVLILALYQIRVISIPLPISNVPGQRFASFVTGLLVRYIPFPFATSPSPGSVLRLKTTRDRTLFLCTIPVLQFFALSPTPTFTDLLVLLPLALISTSMVSGKKVGRKDKSLWDFPNKSLSTARSSWSFMFLVPARWRPHLQTVLNTPTSSRIFYFLLLNLAYMFVQMVYGVATNSLGLISDAIHMAFDCLGLAVGLWASVAATWKPDGRYTFGYARVETLSGFANGKHPTTKALPPRMTMGLMQIITIIAIMNKNMTTAIVTHDHSHDHSSHSHSHALSHSHSHNHNDHDHSHSHSHDDHGHSHDHAHSHNMRGVFLHVMADTLGSVGVIISTILIKYTGWTVFDPIASLFIAVLIMASVIPLVIDSGKVLCLDVGSEKEEEIRSALSELTSVDGVANYASPRFWPRCEGELIGSIHIQLSVSPSSFDPSKFSTPYLSSKSKMGNGDGNTIYVNSEKVVSRVEKVLKKRIKGLSELVVQVEGSEERGYCTCMTGR